ncbi:ParA family protein (plasmid) [Haloferacaceae archaeon DSL9]
MTLRAAVFLDKGGTGKTTTTAHLGRALSELGYKGLLIDLAGKQSDLAKQFGLYDRQQAAIENGEDFPNISTIFDDDFDKLVQLNGAEVIFDRLIMDTGEELDLIPAHPGLDSIDGELNHIEDRVERYGRLNGFLDSYVEELDYDFILIDLPGLSSIVPYNGIWAAENIVVPVEMGPFEFDQARSLAADVEKYRENWAIDAEISMVVPNKVDARTKLNGTYLEKFEAAFNGAMAPAGIPNSQDIRNSTDVGQTIFELTEPSSTASRAREAYLENADALVDRLGGVA